MSAVVSLGCVLIARAAIPWGSRGPDPPLFVSVGVQLHVEPPLFSVFSFIFLAYFAFLHFY
jgi:hypothetical protein